MLSDWRKTGDGEWARQRDDVGTGPVWIRRVPHGYQWCVVWLGCSVAGGSQPIAPYGDGPAIMAAREAADAAALRWDHLPDEAPSRADIRPPASLADATAVRMVAALLRDLAESQRANREAAEILRAVGTERALEAAEKCEANS